MSSASAFPNIMLCLLGGSMVVGGIFVAADYRGWTGRYLDWERRRRDEPPKTAGTVRRWLIQQSDGGYMATVSYMRGWGRALALMGAMSLTIWIDLLAGTGSMMPPIVGFCLLALGALFLANIILINTGL